MPIYCYVSGRSIFKIGLKKKIDSLEPDMLFVHGDGTLVAMEFILRYRKLNYGVIFDSHMLRMASENYLREIYRLSYRIFLTPIIKKNKLVFIRTQDDDYVEKCLSIPLSQAPFISHATDQLMFYPDKKIREETRNKLKIKENDFVVLYAGKLVESKGAELLTDVFARKFETSRRVILLVIGNTSGVFGEMVEKKFSMSENYVIRIPTQKYCNLPRYYCAADIAVFPKQCSLSFFDVQACALPVVEEENNINRERLSHNNGFCFKENNIDDFRRQILKCIQMPKDQFDDMKNAAKSYIDEFFSYDKVYSEYEKAIEGEYNRQGRKK